MSKQRECGPRRSTKHPEAYNKEELVELAVKKLDITKSQANKLTKDELCEKLFKIASKGSESKSKKRILPKFHPNKIPKLIDHVVLVGVGKILPHIIKLN